MVLGLHTLHRMTTSKPRRTKTAIEEERLQQAQAQKAADLQEWLAIKEEKFSHLLSWAIKKARVTISVGFVDPDSLGATERVLSYIFTDNDNNFSDTSLPLNCTRGQFENCEAELYSIIRTNEEKARINQLREQAKAKLTDEEKKALGLTN